MFPNTYDLLQEVTTLLTTHKLKISTAESITAGRFASLLTSIPGSSVYFDSALIVYSNAAKTNLLNIDQQVIAKHGAVSTETAALMSTNLLKLTNTQVGISLTGNAGPEPMESQGTEMWSIFYLAFCVHFQP